MTDTYSEGWDAACEAGDRLDLIGKWREDEPATVYAERDTLRDALEEIYRDVGVGGLGPMIAARALRKGVWAES